MHNYMASGYAHRISLIKKMPKTGKVNNKNKNSVRQESECQKDDSGL